MRLRFTGCKRWRSFWSWRRPEGETSYPSRPWLFIRAALSAPFWVLGPRIVSETPPLPWKINKLLCISSVLSGRPGSQPLGRIKKTDFLVGEGCPSSSFWGLSWGWRLNCSQGGTKTQKAVDNEDLKFKKMEKQRERSRASPAPSQPLLPI